MHCWTTAAAAGKGGVELWIRDDAGAITDTFMAASTPRLLAMRAKIDGRDFGFIVGHAPDATHGETAIKEWWAMATKATKEITQHDVPTIGMFDANAEIGEEGVPDLKTLEFEK